MKARAYFGEGPIIAPPRAEAPAPSIVCFIVSPLVGPMANLGDQGLQELYRLAYDSARSALRPSWYECLCRTPRN
jgi:hypothetical protein